MDSLKLISFSISKICFVTRNSSTTEANFTDVFNHCWQGSSPLLAELDREKRGRAQKVLVQNEIDSLVESMFCEEEAEEETAEETGN
jgi:hypothetical protein